MSKDTERDIAQAALWAIRWRELELEAFEVTRSLSDPEAKRHMLFVSEYYGSLADRADKERLVRLATEEAEEKGPDSMFDVRGKEADDDGEAS
jgi:hypothetical protein